MKYILIILVSILSLAVCSIIYIGESNSYIYMNLVIFWDIPRVKIIYWIIKLDPH